MKLKTNEIVTKTGQEKRSGFAYENQLANRLGFGRSFQETEVVFWEILSEIEIQGAKNISIQGHSKYLIVLLSNCVDTST